MRRNSGRLYGAAVLVVAGFVVNRLNVSITGLEGAQGGRYVPSVAEGIITLMLVAIGVAAFGLAVRFLPVMHQVEEPELVAGDGRDGAGPARRRPRGGADARRCEPPPPSRGASARGGASPCAWASGWGSGPRPSSGSPTS